MSLIKPQTVFSFLVALILFGCGEDVKMERRVILHPNKGVAKEWHVQVLANGDTLIQGPVKEFFWGGTPASSEIYKDGARDGSSQAWYEKGGLKWAKVYSKGKKTGPWRLYFPDKRNWVEVNYVDDALHGKATRWDRSDPTLILEAEFAHGNCVSGSCGIFEMATLDTTGTKGAVKEAEQDRALLSAFLQ